MASIVGKIFAIGNGYNAGGIRKVDALPAQNFIQASVSSGQTFNLEHPAQRNSVPYGDSPLAKRLDILS